MEPTHRVDQRLLREARATAGVTQAQLAVTCGVDRTYIVHLENGRRQPSAGTLVAIADALGVTCADLLVEVPASAPERMLTTDQLAELLGVDRETLLRWVRQGKVTAVPMGRAYRYSRAEVARLARDGVAA